MLGIGYVSVIFIPCSCYACLIKLDLPWNRRQDKFNQVRLESENQQCVYWAILGSYNNWQITNCIDSIKKHE